MKSESHLARMFANEQEELSNLTARIQKMEREIEGKGLDHGDAIYLSDEDLKRKVDLDDLEALKVRKKELERKLGPQNLENDYTN